MCATDPRRMARRREAGSTLVVVSFATVAVAGLCLAMLNGSTSLYHGARSRVELAVAEAALEAGRPVTRRELRLLIGADKRMTDRAVNALQRKLVLTNAGRTAGDSGWSSTLHDLFARRWRAKLRRVPARERAVLKLSEAVLRGADDVSAADLAAALRLRRREAADVLEALEAKGVAVPRLDDGIAVWAASRR